MEDRPMWGTTRDKQDFKPLRETERMDALNSQILFDATDNRAIFQPHVVDAHAKYLTGKWFRWRLNKGDRVLAKADLQRRYERYNSRDSG